MTVEAPSSSAPQAAVGGARSWVRPPGLELLGRVEGSGLRSDSYLVRRSDGQTVQVSELLQLVLASVAPERTAEEVADSVSAAYGRRLTAEGLEHVITTRLQPLGLVAPAAAPGEDARSDTRESRDPAPPRATPLLSLSLRGTILPASWVWAVGGILRPLFWPPVVAVALVAAVVLDVRLLRTADVGSAVEQVLLAPPLMVALWVVLILGNVVHELGHGTACRHGGARPGAIGVGVYLLFPAFYTDVTDSYRLPRAGRLRVDLGGLYFNVLCLVALALLYLGTGNGIFLLASLVMHLEMLQQLVPAVRLDGYYVLADLAGVPDLFARVGPVLRSLRPGAERDPRVEELRPGARRVVVTWVLIVTPTLLAGAVWLLVSLPTIVGQSLTALQRQTSELDRALGAADAAAVALSAIAMVLVVVPLLGLAVLAWRLFESSLRLLLRSATGPRAVAGGTAPATPATRGGWPSRWPRAAGAGMLAPSGGVGDVLGASGAPSEEDTMSTSSVTREQGATAPTTPAGGPAVPSTDGPQPNGLPRPHVPHTGPRPSSADFRDDLMLPVRAPAPGSGWRRTLYQVTGRTVNLGPGPEERRRAELETRLRAPITGSRRIVVMSRKGGVGKTTMSFALGSTFAALRGDRVVAVDANPDAGNLAHRVSRPNEATITDVLADLEDITTYARLRDYTSQAAESRLEVLASDDDPRIGMALDRHDYHRLIGLLDRFYNLIVLDTGTGILDSANQGLLAEADQIVLVSRPGIDGGRAAALTLDWLDEHDHEDLVRGAVVVVNGVRPGVGAPLSPIVDHFERRCQAVVTVPWDPVLETGGQTQLSSLREATRHGLVEVAAAVADGFTATRPGRGAP